MFKLKKPDEDDMKYKAINSKEGVNSNLLILLHGLGDNEANFGEFGKRLELPQTRVCSLRGTIPLGPLMGGESISAFDGEEIDEFGYAWYFEEEWEVGEDVQKQSVKETLKRLETWLEKSVFNEFPPERVFLFGYGQGGSVCVELAKSKLFRLGGVVSVSGHEMNWNKADQPSISSRSCKSDILITTTCNDRVALCNSAKSTSSNTSQYSVYAVPGKTSVATPSSREEMGEIMKFLSKRLYLRNLGLEAMADNIIHLEKL